MLKGMGITFRHIFRRAVNFQYPDEKRDDLAPRFRGELKLTDVLGTKVNGGDIRVETQQMPPCMSTCPTNVKIREYVGLVSMGRFDEAIEVIKQDNPLPLVCGRVCPHPCEGACRRGEKDESVAINPIKRFAADYDLKMRLEGKGFKPHPKAKKNKKVACVGAGPAGLTCAYYLALEGYQVTIFEKLPVAGGMLAVGIPDYRLPREILQDEVDQIVDLGVDIKLNTGVDDLDSLLKDGFDAVFLGVGAHRAIKLEIDGEDLKGVIPGEQFLKEIALDEKTDMGKKVAVVGGGNTAIDCARVSLREGAKEVYILYRRTAAEMPAHHIEVEDADEEGVNFLYLAAPTKIMGDAKGRVNGVECVKMKLGEKDKSGRRRPVPIEGSEFVLEVDTIMSAISREPEVDWLEGSAVKIHSRYGTIETDPVTGETSKPGIFAGGDVSLGPNIAIAAIGGGKRAAFSIDAYLSGRDIKNEHRRRSVDALVKPLFEAGLRNHGAKMEPMERVKGYEEAEFGFTQEQAVLEAKRCLSCQTRVCIGCEICSDNCMAQAIDIHADQDERNRWINKWDLRGDRCVFCGICVENCPTKTLYHTHKYELAEYSIHNFLKHKDYLLRDESEIENEGWTKRHKHVATSPLLYRAKPRSKSNAAWERSPGEDPQEEKVSK
jgi:NADPH-dependent glutamate synthase beta subunit-like oxidoreductase